MSLTVDLITNSSPVEKIGKTLTAGASFSCVLKEDTSVLRPVIEVVSSSNLSGYNYMYISEFGRYYFVDDIVSLNDGRWEISAHVDVLETYKTSILANSAVIRRQASLYNLYLDDPDFHTYNYDRIQTIKFPANSFNKALNYVLVLNGSAEAQQNREVEEAEAVQEGVEDDR